MLAALKGSQFYFYSLYTLGLLYVNKSGAKREFHFTNILFLIYMIVSFTHVYEEDKKAQVGNEKEKAQSESIHTPKAEVEKTKLALRYLGNI